MQLTSGLTLIFTCIEQETGMLFGSEIKFHCICLTADGVHASSHEVIEDILRPKKGHLRFLCFYKENNKQNPIIYKKVT